MHAVQSASEPMMTDARVLMSFVDAMHLPSSIDTITEARINSAIINIFISVKVPNESYQRLTVLYFGSLTCLRTAANSLRIPISLAGFAMKVGIFPPLSVSSE